MWWRRREQILFLATGVLTVAGVAGWVAGGAGIATAAWTAATVVGLLYSTGSLAVAVRRRQPSVDVIAWLALAGALAVGEVFAGAVVAVMLASGALLEARAAARARRELHALVARAPRTARRQTPHGAVEVPVDQVAVGDRLLVGAGEIVPVDGRLLDDAVLDESALTGEPLPVTRRAGDDVRSGTVNTEAPVGLVATTTAAASTYAGVVRLVEQAQAGSAPFVRVADRVAVAFVPVTLLLAGAAWLAAADPTRAVAVLVVATPCPLLLAAPIAIMSGLSRAARGGVIVKGGAALERLATGKVLLFDKTGTLTGGRPALTDVVTPPGGLDADEVLRLAAGLETVSAHVLAAAIVTAARDRGLPAGGPHQVREVHGYGVEGVVDGRRVRLGKAAWIVTGQAPAWVRHARRRAALDGSLAVFVAVDGAPAGVLLLEDPVRPQAPRMVRALRAAGIARVVLVTGDRAETAEAVGRVVGVDAVHADCDPADKVALVRAEQRHGPTVMVGDGINDAPALAAAGVGVALAARGATASAEAADVVLTVDRIDALADAVLIARRCRTIAAAAVGAGMGACAVAMVVAAAGHLPPAVGAVLQEGIDLAAIGIALTALLPVRLHTVAMRPADVAVARRLYTEHRGVRALVEQVRTVADDLLDPPFDLAPVRVLLARLQAELLPHERAEEAQLLPIVARALGGSGAAGALSRTHAEIEHQVSRLRRSLEDLPDSAQPEDVVDVRRVLYGLYAVLRLHNAQEEEDAFSLIPARRRAPVSVRS
ncbi:heavy metal translocating P-type ATPase [Dactylosporangium aurantiacum]|uniref:Heavy metal translocating P-type ATPase n=1 Tax=Dactylosporangium aurantiacum TaxID=35754 RepID=A0A9Q9IR49_9ACTN|nr:heavy metal translocating P-type ATPase [Dactylosporangium aurantiacum]MDG6105942.1 heavy metal translocating P-type ATPase [Dactylosporangium aurantiacum]UWZ57889.1 heavy metal translocating P-type ATPase [Dactylosporangium aurantiacum]